MLLSWETVHCFVEFEWARGHPVERENYVEDLLNSVSKLEVTNVENNRSA